MFYKTYDDANLSIKEWIGRKRGRGWQTFKRGIQVFACVSLIALTVICELLIASCFSPSSEKCLHTKVL